MSAHAQQGPALPAAYAPPHRSAEEAWSTVDRLLVIGAWVAGIGVCVITLSIVIFMAIKGLQFLDLSLLTSHPETSLDQAKSGGFLDPILGTFVLAFVGIAIALPLGVSIATWLTEFGRPAPLA